MENYEEFKRRAEGLLSERLKNENLKKHCYAVMAIMEELALHYGEDHELWGLTGLVHDADYEETKMNLSQHSLVSALWLKELGFPDEVVRAVKVHNEMHGLPLETRLEKALTFADAMAGLVVAAVLVLPSKKASDLKPESVLKRLKEKDFARGVNREEIMRCEEEDIPIEKFSGLSVRAIQRINDKLGL